MSDPVIEVKGLYKKFCRSLKRGMVYSAWDVSRSMIGIPYPTDTLRKDEFWALQDINFKLKKGEILGIIGVNGSGKSTLLRLLTGIFPPDAGSVRIQGQVGALIAVGAGFHPHMTGRENIFLNGTILGMSHREIVEKYNAIVDFAEIGDFLEAPVATYSSGMRVRLGFSVAIHRVPEVLLIDEVLSVGDVAFKKKCMSKMEEIKNQSSIVFISHNMNQVERICDRAILMEKGEFLIEGTPRDVISRYYDQTIRKNLTKENALVIQHSTQDIYHLKLSLTDMDDVLRDSFTYGEDINFNFSFESRIDAERPNVGITIQNSQGIQIGSIKSINLDPSFNIRKGKNRYSIRLIDSTLLPDTYTVLFKWKLSNNTVLLEATGKKFMVEASPHLNSYDGIVGLKAKWTFDRVYQQIQ